MVQHSKQFLIQVSLHMGLTDQLSACWWQTVFSRYWYLLVEAAFPPLEGVEWSSRVYHLLQLFFVEKFDCTLDQSKHTVGLSPWGPSCCVEELHRGGNVMVYKTFQFGENILRDGYDWESVSVSKLVHWGTFKCPWNWFLGMSIWVNMVTPQTWQMTVKLTANGLHFSYWMFSK